MSNDTQEKRLDSILESIQKIASLNFSERLKVTKNLDKIDALAIGLNMLSEEIEAKHLSLEQKIKERTVEKKILNSILLSQEKVRQDVSRNLHDGVAQTLYGLKHHVEYLELKLKDINNEELTEYAFTIKKHLKESIENTRSIAMKLMPISLIDIGLVPSIQSLINTFNYSFKITLDSDIIEKNPSDEVNIAFYRTILGILEKASESKNIKSVNIQLTNEHKLNLDLKIYGDFEIEKNEKEEVIDTAFLTAQKRLELLDGSISYIRDKEKQITILSAEV